MNIIDTKAIGKIILNENTPNRAERREHYLIPYYQRGYRWGINHVEALLEDIHNFIRLEEKKYCLQPIVLVPMKDEEDNRVWEVIDGQQRLITMKLIFQYLKKPSYVIKFEKREKSTAFLRNLSPETYSDENPDFHYLSQAHKVIKSWIDKKAYNDIGYIDEFNTALTKHVEVIWYQIEELKDSTGASKAIESKKIDIFNRLNIGKIPLTDAELVRAFLLSKIKHGTSEREAILRQAEISNEWHRMEMELRDPLFWYFLNNSELKENSSTIEFIFKLIADSSDKKYSTYLWIEKKIKSEDKQEEKDNANNFWIKTKEYFSKLKYWYQDDLLFHQIGFLLAISKEPIATLKKLIRDSNCQKSEFIEIIQKAVEKNVDYIDLNALSYEKNKDDIKRILLLYNIQSSYLDKRKQSGRFPFNLYKDEKWTIEHIHAQDSTEMKEKKAIKKWLTDTYESIKDINEIEKNVTRVNEDEERVKIIEVVSIKDIALRIKKMMNLESIDLEDFNLLKNELVKTFESDNIHELDNLALLSDSDNSALNNAIFPVKRNRVLNLAQQGRYIPQATLNVFLKSNSLSDLQPYYWSRKDKIKYFEDIKQKLSPFFTNKD